jgi:hypothetical protein
LAEDDVGLDVFSDVLAGDAVVLGVDALVLGVDAVVLDVPASPVLVETSPEHEPINKQTDNKQLSFDFALDMITMVDELIRSRIK